MSNKVNQFGESVKRVALCTEESIQQLDDRVIQLERDMKKPVVEPAELQEISATMNVFGESMKQALLCMEDSITKFDDRVSSSVGSFSDFQEEVRQAIKKMEDTLYSFGRRIGTLEAAAEESKQPPKEPAQPLSKNQELAVLEDRLDRLHKKMDDCMIDLIEKSLEEVRCM